MPEPDMNDIAWSDIHLAIRMPAVLGVFLDQLAMELGVQRSVLVQQIFKVGILAAKVHTKPDAALLFRDGAETTILNFLSLPKEGEL